jgi:Flp pilus assembly protein TadD
MKTPRLDVDEYFHLALHASSVGEHHACMSYLEEVLEQQPANARALYLLAVQYGELGLVERAVSGIKSALAIEPALEIARLHLGLLLLFDRDRPAEAKDYLLALGSSTDCTLRTYAGAMIALADGDRARAREMIAFALTQPAANQPLAALMRRLLEQIPPNGAKTEAVVAEHVLLGECGPDSS